MTADYAAPALLTRPSVSVVVCTYTERRQPALLAAVGSAVAQLRASDECLVVIDHNDVLRRLATIWFADQPLVRVVANVHARGLSGARNTGIACSGRDVIAFLDDDATAAADWLDECLRALTEPGVVGVGAAALPQWPGGTRPNWFPPEFDWVVGCSYRGLPPHRAPVRNVIGAAMAFRRQVFAVAGLFHSSVGRVGAAPVGCEETELCIRLRQADPQAEIVYLPSAVVHHRVTEERTRVRYFVRRCFGEGRSKARVSRLVGRDDGLASERAYLRRVLPAAAARELGRAARGRPAGLAATVLIIAGVTAAGLGYLRERVAGRATGAPATEFRGRTHA
jgi:glycosyltransferase involved in cell wall biosynthesis